MSKENDNVGHGEFEVKAFAVDYEVIADTFIDTKGAAASLVKMLPKNSTVFELGLGTGYFAQFLYNEGLNVSGIEPSKTMASELKQRHPYITIAAELALENYDFDTKHEAIVSHSSIFLFTAPHEDPALFTDQDLIFQSFLVDEDKNIENLQKVLSALTDKGKLFINIQTNAKPSTVINEHLTFKMLECDYNFSSKRVSKLFALVADGETKLMGPDVSYVLRWHDFSGLINGFGYKTEVSEDKKWVIISRI